MTKLRTERVTDDQVRGRRSYRWTKLREEKLQTTKLQSRQKLQTTKREQKLDNGRGEVREYIVEWKNRGDGIVCEKIASTCEDGIVRKEANKNTQEESSETESITEHGSSDSKDDETGGAVTIDEHFSKTCSTCPSNAESSTSLETEEENKKIEMKDKKEDKQKSSTSSETEEENKKIEIKDKKEDKKKKRKRLRRKSKKGIVYTEETDDEDRDDDKKMKTVGM